MSEHDQLKTQLSAVIAREYVNSPDFNGVAFPRLTVAVARPSVEVGRSFELVAEGAMYADFGHEGAQPLHMTFSHPGAAADHPEVARRGGVSSALLYPTKATLDDIGAGDRYPGASYSASLALGSGQLDSEFFCSQVLAKYRDDPRHDYTSDIGGEIRPIAPP